MRELKGLSAKISFLVIISWAGIVLYTSWVGGFHPVIQGMIAFALPALILCFMMYPVKQRTVPSHHPSPVDVICIILAVICCIYVLFRYETWMVSFLAATTLDLTLSGILLVVILEAARRTLGRVMFILTLMVLAYTFLGRYIPGTWGTPKTMNLFWVLNHLYTTDTGYAGMITWIISTVVCIYVLAGGVLFKCGAGETFIDISKLFAGRIRGGGGVLSVFASAFFGMISGSPVASVATVGSFTIPLMKRLGYGATFSGAVATASATGGQIMPPVMGAGAFIMAEMLGIPYIKVCIAAALPALLYFLGVAMAVYFETRKRQLGKLPREEMPSLRSVISWRKVGPLTAFIGILLLLLFQGRSPQISCFWALIAMIGLFVFTTGKLRLAEMMDRFKAVGDGLVHGTRNLINLGCVILCVQVVVSLISLTGAGLKFSELVYYLGEQQILISLILGGLIAIVLGLGLPTTAAYMLGISVLGIGLVKLGISPLSANLFVFYYAILSEVTPPVSLSAVVAAGISGGHFLPIGWLAWRLALPAFIIPLMFAFHPTLLLQGDFLPVLITAITAVIGVILFSAGLQGFLFKPSNILERIIMLGCSFCLIYPSYVLSFIGLGVAIPLLAYQLFLSKKANLILYKHETNHDPNELN